MSTTVDEKIVEMQFDNRQFEANVKTSLNTIERLKKSLKFEKTSVGLEKIGKAAKELDVSQLERSIGRANSSFLRMRDVIKMTLIQDITRWAERAGAKLIRSLSIDQISSGWDKYAEKTAAVQTIMAATASQFTDTAKQMEYVNEQLDKLNWFTDETSFNFLDMVNNIGKFTSNNIKLDDAVTAMEGISNWAAISGASVNEASRAMYNLSQAISMGSLKLQDWKSIELANMATAQFKQTAMETAAELGTLKKATDGTFKNMKSQAVTVETFRETLQSGWLTSDVLMATLAKYGSFTDKLNDVMDHLDGSFSTSTVIERINDYIDGVKTAEEISLELTGASDELVESIKELAKEEYQLGRDSFIAAQQAKTFLEAINSVKDAVSSSWMRSFEIIFGGYTDARDLWTKFANDLWDIFASGGEKRNEFLSDIFDSQWSKLTKVIKEAGYSVEQFEESVKSASGKDSDELDKLIKKYGSLERVIQHGEIATSVIQEALTSLSTEEKNAAGDLSKLSGEFLKYRDAVSSVWWSGSNREARLQQLADEGYEMALVYKLLESTAAEFDKTVYHHWTTEEEFNNALKTTVSTQTKAVESMDDTTTALSAVQKAAAEAGVTLEEYIDLTSGISTRERLVNIIHNLLVAIVNFKDTISGAFASLFGHGTISAVQMFIYRLEQGTEALSEFSENNKTLKTILDGMVSILSYLLGIINTVLKKAFRIVGNGIKYIWDKLPGFLAALQSGAVTFKNFGGKLVEFAKKLKGPLDEFMRLPFIASSIEAVKKIFTNIFTAISDALSSAGSGISNFLDEVLAMDDITLDDIVGWFIRLKDAVVSFFQNLDLKEMFNNLLGFLPDMSTIGEGVKNFISNIIEYFKNFKIDPSAITGIFKRIGDALRDFAVGLGEKFGLAKDTILEFFGRVKDMIPWVLHGLGLLLVFDIAKKIFRIVSIVRDGLESVIDLSYAVKGAISRVSKALAFKIATDGIFVLASAITMLCAALAVMTYLPQDELREAAISMSIVIGVFAAAVAATAFLARGLSAMKTDYKAIAGLGVVMMALSASIWLITNALENLKNIKLTDIWEGLATLGISLVALTAAAAVLSKFSGNTWQTSTTIVAFAAALYLLTYALKSLVGLNLTDLMPGATAIFVMLVGLGAAVALAGKAAGQASFKGLLAFVVSLWAFVKLIQYISSVNIGEIEYGLSRLIPVLITFAASTRLMRLVGGDASKIGLGLLGAAAAVFILVQAMKALVDLSDVDIERGTEVIKSLLNTFNLMVVASKFTGNGTGWNAVMFLGAAAAIAALVGVMHLLRDLSLGDIGKSLLAFTAITVLFDTLMIASGKMATGKGVFLSMLTMFAGLALVTGYIVNLGKDLEHGDMMGITSVAIGVLVAVLGVVAVMHSLNAVKDIDDKKILVRMASFALIFAAIGYALSSIYVMNLKEGLANLLVVTGITIAIVGSMAGVFVAMKSMKGMSSAYPKTFAKNITAIVVAMMAIIGSFAAIAYISGNRNTNFKTIGVMIAGMIGMLFAVSVMLKNMKGMSSAKPETMRNNFVTIAATIAVLTAAMGLISLISLIPFDPSRMLAIVAGMAVIMLALTALIGHMSDMNGVAWSSIGKFSALLIVSIGAITGALLLINNLTKGSMIPGSKIANILALSAGITMIILSLSVLMLAAKSMSGMDMKGVGTGIIAILAAFTAIIIAFNFLSSINSFKLIGITSAIVPIIFAISTMIASMALLSFALKGTGLKTMAASLGGMAVIIGLVLGALYALSKMDAKDDMQSILESADLLSQIAGAIGEVIGAFAGGILKGIIDTLEPAASSILHVVTQLALVAAALTLIPVSSFDKLKAIGIAVAALGAGELMTAFAGWLEADTPTAEQATTFSSKVIAIIDACKELFDKAKKIDPNIGPALSGVAQMILAFGASELFSAISNVIDHSDEITTEAGNTANVASTMKQFADGLQPFAESLYEMSQYLVSHPIDQEAITTATKMGTMLNALNWTQYGEGGMVQDILGEKDMGKFGEQIKSFANSLVDISKTMTENPPDETALTNFQTYGKMMAGIQTALYGEGGWVQAILGEKSLGDFATDIVKLGLGLSMFSTTIKNSFGDDYESVSDAAGIAKTISEAASAIPYGPTDVANRILSWIGVPEREQMSTFAQQLGNLATGLIEFNDKIVEHGGLNQSALAPALDALNVIGLMAERIPSRDGFNGFLALFGEDSVSAFVNAIPQMGDALKTFLGNVGGSFSARSVLEAASGLFMLIQVVNNAYYSARTVNPGTLKERLEPIMETLNSFMAGIDTSKIDISAVNAIASILTAISSIWNSVADGVVNEYGFANDEGIMTNLLQSMLSTDGMKTPDGEEVVSPIQQFLDEISGYADKFKQAGSTIGSNLISGLSAQLSIAGLTNLGSNAAMSIYAGAVNAMNLENLSDIFMTTRAIKELATAISLIKNYSMDAGDAYDATGILSMFLVNIGDSILALSEDLEGTNLDAFKTTVEAINSLYGIMNLLTVADPNVFGAKLATLGDVFYELFNMSEYGDYSMPGKVIIDTLAGFTGQFIETGKNYVAGLITGLGDGVMLGTLAGTAAMVATLISSTVNGVLDIHSPSGVGYASGRFFNLGIANGMSDSAVLVENSASKVANNMSSALQTVLDYFGTDVNLEPTIRPVMDLSDVRAGARNLNVMLSKNRAIVANPELYAPEGNQNGTSTASSVINYTQNNYSPKALSRVEIYRQTRRQLAGLHV